MVDLSYSLSPALREKIREIDFLRTKILTTPLSPRSEMKLKWESMLDKIKSSLLLSGYDVSEKEIVKTITAPINLKPGVNHKNLDEKQEEILKYKTALDYLNQEWLVNPKNVTLRDLLSLYDIFGKGSLNGPSSNLQDLLDYIQAHRENPIIQSGVAFLGIERTTPFTTGNSRFARLLAYLFLYKDGYDVKGLIQFDKKWAEDLSLLNDALRVGLSAASITIWLEFYAQSIIENLRATLEEIGKTKDYNIGLDNSLWEINDRQKEILNLLEQPNTTITNRKVTKRFKISQITASRDLSKLATLGLLFPHGKGRSVYYTKV